MTSPARPFAIYAAGLLAALVCIDASPAAACSPIGYERSGSPRSLQPNEARFLVQKAASVELVVADQRRFLDLPALLGSRLAEAEPSRLSFLRDEIALTQPWVATVTFRVIETLKGSPSAAFDLNAMVTVLPAEDERRRWARDRGGFNDPSTYWLSGAAPLNEAFDLDGCVEPPRVVMGGTYLVFRDVGGRILDATLPFRWRHSRQEFVIQGPVFEEIFGDNDPWLRRVRREAAGARVSP